MVDHDPVRRRRRRSSWSYATVLRSWRRERDARSLSKEALGGLRKGLGLELGGRDGADLGYLLFSSLVCTFSRSLSSCRRAHADVLLCSFRLQIESDHMTG